MNMDLSSQHSAFSNLIEGASLYATLTSVLSGFAFTALVLLFVASLDSSNARNALAAAGRALVGVFLGLLIMTVIYSGQATNLHNDGLTMSETLILLVGISGVGVAIIFTIVLMIDAAGAVNGNGEIRKVATFTRVSAGVLNLLIMGMTYDTVNLYENYAYTNGPTITGMDVLNWLLLGIELAALLYVTWAMIRRPATNRFKAARDLTPTLVGITGLGAPILSGVGFLFVDTQLPDKSAIGSAWVVLITFAIFAMTTAGSLLLLISQPAVDNPAVPDGPGKLAEMFPIPEYTRWIRWRRWSR